MNRRDALIAFASSIAAATALPVAAQASIDRNLMVLVADTILPKDDLTPSASEIGAVDEVLEMVQGHPMLQQLMAFGLQWVNQVQGRPFKSLSPEDREGLLLAASESDFNQVPGRFFHVIKVLLLEAYYSKPAALVGLPLHPAPQPEGYLPPWS